MAAKLWAQNAHPSLKFDDAITIGLVVLAAAPWLAQLLESAKFGGVELTFLRLEREQKFQGNELERQRQELQNSAQLLFGIIQSMVGEDGKEFLKKLAAGEPINYEYSKATEKDYRKMVRQLRLLGFIMITSNDSVHDIIDDKRGDIALHEHVRLMQAGKDYLQSKLIGHELTVPDDNKAA